MEVRADIFGQFAWTMNSSNFGNGQPGASLGTIPRMAAKAPRAVCPSCGLDVPMRGDGTIGEHRVFKTTPSVLCDGFGRHWDAPARKMSHD